jgi:hypothetical protein
VKESEKIEGEYLETERDAQGGRSKTTAETAETVDRDAVGRAAEAGGGEERREEKEIVDSALTMIN